MGFDSAQNTSSELNHTTDSFINSMLGYEDDVLFMDIGPNVNESM